MTTLQKRFISFISKCLSSSNSIVDLISHLAIINPLSSAGKNYSSAILVDADCELKNRYSINRWNNSRKVIENTVTILKELIDIKKGYKECVGFYSQEINVFMPDLCTGYAVHYFIFCTFYNVLYYMYVICISKCTTLILLLCNYV